MRKLSELPEETRKLLDLYPFKPGNYSLSLFVRQRLLFNKFEIIEKLMPREGKLIDIGCGYGIFANYLALTSAKRSVVGIDINWKKAGCAGRGLDNADFVAGNVMNMKLGPCTGFSLLDMLHHLDEYEQQDILLKFCYDSLEEKGKILIKEIDNTPGLKFYFTQLADRVAYPFDKIYFRGKRELKEILEKIGFKVELYPIDEGTPYPAFALVGEKE